jgi:hypothetical protein
LIIFRRFSILAFDYFLSYDFLSSRRFLLSPLAAADFHVIIFAFFATLRRFQLSSMPLFAIAFFAITAADATPIDILFASAFAAVFASQYFHFHY